MLAWQSCAKSDIDPPQVGGGPSLYFRGQVDNEFVVLEAGKNNYSLGNSGFNWGVPVWSAVLITPDNTGDGISIFLSSHSKTVDSTKLQADLEQTLAVNSKQYTQAPDVGENEVFISYKKGALVYESALIDQTGSNFNIKSVKDTLYQNHKFTIAEFEFNAALYSVITQDTIKINNGVARMAFMAKP